METETLVLKAELLAHVDPPILPTATAPPELKPVAIEQLPGSEKEPEKDGILRLPPEAEILQACFCNMCR